MAHRKNVEIKTKFKSSKECSDNCTDIWSKFALPFGISKKIYGIVYEDGTLWLSNCSKMGSIFKFEGKIETRNEGVYLVGDISVKYGYLILLYSLCLFFNIIGLILTFNVNPFGFILIAVGWMYIIIINKSDILYNCLLSKVQ